MATDTTAVPNERGDDEELDAFTATMSDDQRLAILRTLSVSPGLGSAELAARLHLSPATVRKQLRAMMELGMVHIKESEVRRGVRKLYFVRTRPIWFTDQHDARLSPRQRQSFALRNLRNIVGDARRAIASPDHGARPGWIVANDTGTVDARTWRELSELQHQTLDRMVAIFDAGRARQAEDGEEEEAVSFVAALLLLELPAELEDEGRELPTS